MKLTQFFIRNISYSRESQTMNTQFMQFRSTVSFDLVSIKSS